MSCSITQCHYFGGWRLCLRRVLLLTAVVHYALFKYRFWFQYDMLNEEYYSFKFCKRHSGLSTCFFSSLMMYLTTFFQENQSLIMIFFCRKKLFWFRRMCLSSGNVFHRGVFVLGILLGQTFNPERPGMGQWWQSRIDRGEKDSSNGTREVAGQMEGLWSDVSHQSCILKWIEDELEGSFTSC